MEMDSGFRPDPFIQFILSNQKKSFQIDIIFYKNSKHNKEREKKMTVSGFFWSGLTKMSMIHNPKH